ncbi:TlpA family protein disulfide reductase [Mucilaginibacter xinganensis]|nr:hypothetical protein [Mucilaginibacter xinganensis]
MNFETLIQTKFDYKDSTHINSGNVFFTLYNGHPQPQIDAYRANFSAALNHIGTRNGLDIFLSEKHIHQLADSYARLILKEFPNIKADEKLSNEIKKYCYINVTRFLIYDLCLSYKKPTKNPEIKNNIATNVNRIITGYHSQKDLFSSPDYWMPYSRAYFFYKDALKLDYNGIIEKFDHCNDTVKQYIILRCFRDGITGMQKVNGSFSYALEKFTYPPFKEAALKYLSDPNLGSQISRNLNSTLRNTEIFDTNDKKLQYLDVFKTSTQSYILFDFCGTWCKPCLDEIAQYSQNQHLDNSAKVKPIWLFFENDKTKWIAVIEKYHLKKENCFIILDKGFINEFAKSFNWAQEFPHHFLFTKEGEMIDEKAASLNEFNEDELKTNR